MDTSVVKEVLMLTDPFFWEKAEYITKQASSGTLYLRERLPFDIVTLMYYCSSVLPFNGSSLLQGILVLLRSERSCRTTRKSPELS